VVSGIQLLEGLVEAQKLPEPIFTPQTKAASGHDETITLTEVQRMVGSDLARTLAEKSVALYEQAAEYARSRGIIISDTKFEWGLSDGRLLLIDEVLTPDSSRFWAEDCYQPGCSQLSFDKQYVRDWLESSGWNKEPPAPELPPDVVEKTTEKYLEAYRRLTGKELDRS
jgi:phosphoribosylaminoimidazole-succinocarboxamide synthase